MTVEHKLSMFIYECGAVCSPTTSETCTPALIVDIVKDHSSALPIGVETASQKLVSLLTNFPPIQHLSYR
jgi:hypothetical protein